MYNDYNGPASLLLFMNCCICLSLLQICCVLQCHKVRWLSGSDYDPNYDFFCVQCSTLLYLLSWRRRRRRVIRLHLSHDCYLLVKPHLCVLKIESWFHFCRKKYVGVIIDCNYTMIQSVKTDMMVRRVSSRISVGCQRFHVFFHDCFAHSIRQSRQLVPLSPSYTITIFYYTILDSI